MPGVSQIGGVGYYDRAARPQPRDDFSRIVKPPHMSVAGGEITIGLDVARILLDREEQLRHGLIEPASKEMRAPYYPERRARWGTGTEAQ
jgi:hypothetical protein